MGLCFPARLEPDETGAILVTFRDFPEAHTDGATEAEALVEAKDCLDTVLAFRLKDGGVIPSPSPREDGEVLIEADDALLESLMASNSQRHWA